MTRQIHLKNYEKEADEMNIKRTKYLHGKSFPKALLLIPSPSFSNDELNSEQNIHLSFESFRSNKLYR